VRNLIKQVLIFLIVSFLLTFALYSLGINLLISVGLSVVIQYTLYNAYVYGFDTITALRLKKLEVDRLKQLSLQGTEVTCPCSQQTKEFVPIRLNKPNYYRCKACKKTVGVFTSVETALVTEPLADTDLASIEQLLQIKINEHTGKY